jgi:hypothetical protein
MARDGLTPTEDAELRRLHYLRRFGALTDDVAERLTSLRGRDRRLEVREPEDEAVAAPTTVVAARG